MAKHVNTFVKGIDADTNANSYSNQSYPYAENLRILSDNGLTSGTLSTIQESLNRINLSDSRKIIGITTMPNYHERDTDIILFVKVTSGSEVGLDIYKFHKSVLDSSNSSNISSYKLISNRQLVSSDATTIDVVARYETENIQKIYWTDGSGQIKFANLTDSAATLQDIPVEKFNIIQEVTLPSPKVKAIVSGNLKSGVYQYAYCLYDIHGVETAYSSATTMIPISQSTFTDANSRYFKGSMSGEPTNNGVRVETTENLDSRFKYVRVIRLYYAEQNATPEVHVVHEGANNGKLDFSDYGGVVLGSLVLEDYRYIPNVFSAETLETKNNYLFAGNTKETTFDIDFDARAYRFRPAFNNNPVAAAMFKSVPVDPSRDPNATGGWFSLSHRVIEASDGSSTKWDIGEEYSINIYNFSNVYNSQDTAFKFQADGTTLGGEGKYVKFRFDRTSRPINNAEPNELITYTNGYQDISNPVVLQDSLGYQRGDVYRFGLVLWDKYGRHSFVKHIADIRVLEENDGSYYAITTADENDNNYKVIDVFIQFSLSQSAVDYLTKNEVIGWQIVRAERTYNDAIIKDCGYTLPLRPTSKSNEYRFLEFIYGSGISNRSSNLLEYITPETNYNKNNTIKCNQLKVPYRTSANSSVKLHKQIWKFTWGGTNPASYATPHIKVVSPISKMDTIEKVTISDVKLIKAAKKVQSIGCGDIGVSSSIYPIIYYNGLVNSPNNYATHGTALILKAGSTGFPNSSGANINYARRVSFHQPYGGYSIDAIRNTLYYQCSEIFTLSTDVQTIKGGDCYIGFFEYMRGLCSTDTSVIKSDSKPSTRLGCEVFYGIVETKLNLKYTLNPTWSTLDSGIQASISNTRAGFLGNNLYNAMWETRGVHESGTPEGVDQVAQQYEQSFDLYTYNPVYSAMDKSRVYIVRPPELQGSLNSPTRILRTTRKFNGEPTDSWTKFPTNNFIDLDTKYGGLVRLKTFKDKLFYFQNYGIGVIPIEDREVITSESGGATSIGTGGVMERYDYITTDSGVWAPEHLATSDNFLYYLDTKNRKLYRLHDGLEKLSDLMGIRSLIPSNLSASALLYDLHFNELYIRAGDKTFLFNEYTNSFVSVVNESFTAGFHINNSTYTVDKNVVKELHKGAGTKTWKLNLLINPNGVITNRFDSLTFNTVVSNDSPEDVPIGFIRLYHDEQDSDEKALSPNNIRRRFRRWIFNQMRDSNGRRLYNPWLKVNLRGNGKLLMHDVITEYTAINNK